MDLLTPFFLLLLLLSLSLSLSFISLSAPAYEEWMREHGGAVVNIIVDMFKGFPGQACVILVSNGCSFSCIPLYPIQTLWSSPSWCGELDEEYDSRMGFFWCEDQLRSSCKLFFFPALFFHHHGVYLVGCHSL